MIFKKQGLSANQERNSYRPYAIKLWDKVNSDIQPTNPQAVIVANGRFKYWITDVDLMKHQGNDTESPSDDPTLPEVYTATAACICNVDGNCKGMLTPERPFEKVKYSGLHDNIHPPPMFLASESCIRNCRPHSTQRHCYLQTYKPKDSKLVLTYASPPHHHRPTEMGPSHQRKNGTPPWL